MAGATSTEAPAEQQLNGLLRRVDWRFLLDWPEAPRLVSPVAGRTGRALALISAGGPEGRGAPDLAVIGFPRAASLGAAIDGLPAGGSIVCAWNAPRRRGARRAARRMAAAGLVDVRVYWPGPIPWRAPQFWLPLESAAARDRLLAQRPPRSRLQAALRPLWRAAARAGLLAPLYAVGRAPDPTRGEERPADGISAVFPPTADRMLLTGGARSINKVVGMPLGAKDEQPTRVVKFSRVEAADLALDREAETLRTIEEVRPEVPGIPRLLAQGRRAGRRALAESGVHGRPLISELSEETFGRLTRQVTDWLIALAGDGEALPRSDWWARLAEAPLAEFERNFGAALASDSLRRIRERIEGLGDLPEACEHRDCSPWNIVLTGDGGPGLLDWESAEPRGLPGLDLCYFLANAAFVLDGALESGRTRESYAQLRDPGSRHGREVARREAEYGERLAISAEDLSRLRLLCWIVHSRSDHRHMSMEAGGEPSPAALRDAMFVGLAEEELDGQGGG